MSDERLLLVDDDELIRRMIPRLLEGRGWTCETAATAEEARRQLADRRFALVLCDIGLPGKSGLDLLSDLAGEAPDVVTVMITARDDPAFAERALELGAYGYIIKPFQPNSLLIDVSSALHRRQLALENRAHREHLEQAVHERTLTLQEVVARLRASEASLRRASQETLERLAKAVEFRDGALGEHVERVSQSSRALALACGLDEERAELIRLASPLHDIGKLVVPDEILLKAGPLTAAERTVMEHHTVVGHELLNDSGQPLLELAATIAWTHHERVDGNGYPRGLVGEEIPSEGRIVAVADVYDALCSDRPYRPAYLPQEARSIMSANRGSHFDAELLDLFLEECLPLTAASPE